MPLRCTPYPWCPYLAYFDLPLRRYNDPSAEPVVVHRRSKVAKQTVESSLEQPEDLTTPTSCTEADVGIDDD
jgi:hypothetical protein